MRKPPEGLTGFGEVRSGEGKGGGGPAHGGATPNGVLGSGKAYVPQKLAQKNLEGGAGAHRGLDWVGDVAQSGRRRGPSGGSWRSSRGPGLGPPSVRLIPTGGLAGLL